MDNCDKNFFYFWFSRGKFPYIQNIVFNNHPCEYDMHLRFASNKEHVLVPTIYAHHTWSHRYLTAKTKPGSGWIVPPLEFITNDDYDYVKEAFDDYDASEQERVTKKVITVI